MILQRDQGCCMVENCFLKFFRVFSGEKIEKLIFEFQNMNPDFMMIRNDQKMLQTMTSHLSW